MEFSAQKIAEIIAGTIEGNPKITVRDFGKIEEAKQGQLSFLANPKYEQFLYTTQASIIIVKDDLELKEKIAATLIRVSDPYSAFATLLQVYDKLQMQAYKGIHKKAIIGNKTQIGKNVYIGPNTIIEDGVSIGDNTIIMGNCNIAMQSKIGADCLIYASVNIYKHCVIGNQVIIHAGAVIGSDGFGFAPQQDGSYKKIPQIGNVILENNVEIGANTCIDRATMGSTIIKQGTKLDNLVQIAHNVEIGNHAVIASQAGIAGSTKIGQHARIGGQAGLAGHITIGNQVGIAGQSGVSGDLADGSQVFGSPHMDAKKFYRSYVHFKNLNEIELRLRRMEEKIK